MKVVAAFLLAILGGNATPSAHDINSILTSVGAEADQDKIELLLSGVKGRDISELAAAGREKLASVPSGGACAAPANVSVGGGGGVAAPPAAEPKKEEKVEEKEESDYGNSIETKKSVIGFSECGKEWAGSTLEDVGQ